MYGRARGHLDVLQGERGASGIDSHPPAATLISSSTIQQLKPRGRPKQEP